MPFITKENARDLQRLSMEARSTRANADVALDPYVMRQLSRTRTQLDLLNDILEDRATEMKDRKAAAEAKARLYEIEAALANRPKPGQRRPGRERERPMQPTRAPTPIMPKSQSADPAPVSPRATVDTTSFDCGL